MSKVYAVDLETTDLSPDRGDIRLVALTGPSGSFVTTDVQEIAELLATSSTLKVVHNALFDIYWLRRKGYSVSNFTDTMVLAKLLRGDVKNGNSLASLTKEYLGIDLDKGLQSSENWQGEITEQHLKYAVADSEATYRLFPVLMSQIRERGLVDVAEREIRALPAVIRLQCDGIRFDFESWRVELAGFQAKALMLEREIRSELGQPDLNLKSAPQLHHGLLGIGVDVLSTSQEELAKVRNTSPVVDCILQFKKVQKIISSYGDKMLDMIGPDGRLRGNWRLLGTVTGRMVCAKPNLQGLPKSAKRYCVAEPGCSIVTADYSQIELRVLAALSGDSVMLESFLSGDDLHRRTAAKVFGKAEAEVTDQERRAGKIINFGLVYGMTAVGLRQKLSAQEGMPISLAQAERFRNAYFQLYPGVLRFQDTMLRSSVVKSLGGRRWVTRELKQIMRFNYPVQATAAEGLKESLYLLNDQMPRHWRLIAAIHDELVIEVPKDEVETAKRLLRECMTTGMGCLVTGVPILVDVNAGGYWMK